MHEIVLKWNDLQTDFEIWFGSFFIRVYFVSVIHILLVRSIMAALFVPFISNSCYIRDNDDDGMTMCRVWGMFGQTRTWPIAVLLLKIPNPPICSMHEPEFALPWPASTYSDYMLLQQYLKKNFIIFRSGENATLVYNIKTITPLVKKIKNSNRKPAGLCLFAIPRRLFLFHLFSQLCSYSLIIFLLFPLFLFA